MSIETTEKRLLRAVFGVPRIYNGTPHSIDIVSGSTYDAAIRKFTGGEVVKSIPSDGPLNAQFGETVEAGDIDGIPVFAKDIIGCDDLPEGYGVYIVSALYASAYKARHPEAELYTVADPVMSDDGKTFRGCRGIQKF